MNKIFNVDLINVESFDYDCSEILTISSLSLIKMLRHGKAGIPIEVMGLMLGRFKDETHITVNDVFAMPQTGTGVSVEAIDPVFQTKMLDMYEQKGIRDIIVGWYHSHPGFGCWLSGVDINTQQNFEFLNKRSVAVVIDPVQSVRGKVIIEAYRLNSPISRNPETREVTSIYSMINNPGMFREDHGLNKYYYSLRIGFKKKIIEDIAIASIYQKNPKDILKNQDKKDSNRIKMFNILGKLCSTLRDISFEKFLLYNKSNLNLIDEFNEELLKISRILKSIIQKILTSCLHDVLVEYIL